MGCGREEAGTAPSLLPRCLPEKALEASTRQAVPSPQVSEHAGRLRGGACRPPSARPLRPPSAGAERLNYVGWCQPCFEMFSGQMFAAFVWKRNP